ncbi:MAG: epoxyqueuosine reductase QueH [Lachnospiraceae bacterium]|jgi:predicted adenine nucleotide alpha hydrolase (AANH) superfamily ATPase|nr:epoxyqueuosine reductase QueH [Lachnospiraceae bacterium]
MLTSKTTNTRNFQRELDVLLTQLTTVPRLLLHSCCAPCSSYVLEYLRQYFEITVFYYNPNISIDVEYRKRVAEQKRLIDAYNQLPDSGYSISVIEGDYEPDVFYAAAKGLEQCPEGGERCFACYALRLRKTAELAKKLEQDYFTTTLTISPLKNAAKLNEIGERLSEQYQIPWLASDFKKKNGYKRSIELSAEYNLYRQNYCGCVYSQK